MEISRKMLFYPIRGTVYKHHKNVLMTETINNKSNKESNTFAKQNSFFSKQVFQKRLKDVI